MSDETFFRGAALASVALSVSFVQALVRRGVIDRALAKELVDAALLELETQRGRVPASVVPAFDQARAQLQQLLALLEQPQRLQ